MPTMAAVGLPTKKYNVELVKKGRGHWYDVKSLAGEQLGFFPGVTGVLNVISKPMLIPWAANQATKAFEDTLMERLKGKPTARLTMTPEWIAEVAKEAKARPEKIKTEAADLGTMAHAVFDRIVKGEQVTLEDVPEVVRPPVKNFLGWLKDSGIQMVMGDTRVASINEKFGGSLDALGWRDGKYVLIDFKTSSGIYPEYALQVSAYCVAFEATYGVPVEEACIIRFDKKVPEWDPKKDIRWLQNVTVSYAAFRAAMDLKNLLAEEHFDD